MTSLLAQRCAAVQALLTDVDGVLTNGLLAYDDEGRELKQFNVRDGQGFRLWREAGLRSGIVTSRRSVIVERRAKELQIDAVCQGTETKLDAIRELAREWGLGLEQIAYVGDDLLDLAAVQAVGLGVAVADAAEEVRQAAVYVTSLPGGRGALRETIELLLKNSGRWEDVLSHYVL
ncbi:MAG: HAD hydrolase family protein [Planctomycetales bacterium]|nr:HAD hydrolase family protein [Planctomycetales bacterium]